jgi:chromosome segregation ATPase
MRTGPGRSQLRVSILAEDRRYLESQAISRKTSVSQIVLDAIARFINPEQEQRGALNEQMNILTRTLETIAPELNRLEQTAVRSESLSRELTQLRTDVRQSLQGVEQRLEALAGSRRQHQLRRWVMGGAMLLGSVGLFYFYPMLPLFDAMVATMGLLILVLP